MNSNIWEVTSKVQITFALLIVIFLLMWIAFYKKPASPPHESSLNK